MSRFFLAQIMDWLVLEEQKEIFQSLFSTLFCLVFLALSALLLWPLGKTTMVWSLVKGYYVFWIVLYWTAAILVLFNRVAKIEIDSNFNAYVISALAVSSFLQAGWSSFAAATVQSFVADTSILISAVLYVVGFISCYVTFGIVSSLYPGQLYKQVNLPLSLVSYIVFCLWPASGRLLFGWFFDLVWRIQEAIRSYL